MDDVDVPKLKVLNCLPRAHFGGSQWRVATVARALQPLGVETCILIPQDPDTGFRKFLELHQIPLQEFVWHVPARLGLWRNNLRFMLQLPNQIIRLARLFRCQDIDLVHVNAGANIAPVLACVLSGHPLLWHWNDLLVPSWLGQCLKLLALSPMVHIVASSAQVAQKYQLAQIGGRYLGLLPPPLPQHDARKSVEETELKLPQDRPIIGFVGSLLEKKGALDFIATVALMKRQGTRVRGLMVGSAPSTQDRFYQIMMRKIREFGIEEDIELIGFRHDVPALLSRMDALLFPSHTEAAGIVVLEALAMGVPLVATPVGHVPELLEGLAMPIVPIGDVAAMATGLSRLIGMSSSAREAYRNAAQHRVADGFSAKEIAARHLALYDTVAASSAARAAQASNATA